MIMQFTIPLTFGCLACYSAGRVQDVAMHGSIFVFFVFSFFFPFLRAYISFIFLIMILAEGLHVFFFVLFCFVLFLFFFVFSHICTEFSLTIQNSIPKVTSGASTFCK